MFCTDVLQAGTFLDSMFTATSVFLLVAVAYDRYVAVCRPLSLQKRVGSPLVQGIIRAFICWFIAMLFSIPQVWIHRMIEVNQTGDLSKNSSALSRNIRNTET
jgi:hypothetical protein